MEDLIAQGVGGMLAFFGMLVAVVKVLPRYLPQLIARDEVADFAEGQRELREAFAGAQKQNTLEHQSTMERLGEVKEAVAEVSGRVHRIEGWIEGQRDAS